MANPNDQMKKARALIDQKRYADARKILVNVDHPKAKDWLAKIDKIAPETQKVAKSPKTAKPARSGSGCLGYIASVLISTVITSLLIAVLVLVTQSSWSGEVSAGVAAVPTLDFSASSTAIIRTGTINAAQNVNIRAEPTTGSDVVRVLPPGAAVSITDQTDDGTWFAIVTAEGEAGWIAAELLTVTEITATPPPATAVTAAATEGPTPVPVVECVEGAAQAWWNEQRQLYYQARYVIIQHDENGNTSFTRLIDPFGAAVIAFYEAGTENIPVCIQSTYTALLDGYNFTFEVMEAYNAGDADAAVNWVEEARQLLDEADALLAAEGVIIEMTDCGAEYWLAGLTPNILELDAILNSLEGEIDTNQARSAIFTLQEAARTARAVYTPDCATTARDSLTDTTDTAIELMRSIVAGDTEASQRYRRDVNSLFGVFAAAIQSLGLRFPGT